MKDEARPFVIGVVDDDVSVREALAGLFGSFGFATRCFDSAEELLEAADGVRDLHCLVLDVRMTGMGGLDLQVRLRRSHPALPMIFVTSHDDAATRRRALDGGAVAVFGKPFDRQALIFVVEGLRSRLSAP